MMKNSILRAIAHPSARSIIFAASLLIAGAALFMPKAHAEEPFSRGTVSGSLFIGSGHALDQTYTTLGVGLGYMLSEGLMAGITGEAWFGNDPSIYKLTPEVRYTFTKVQRVKPYIGAFVSRMFFSNTYDDRNSYGARAGIYLPFSTNAAANLGLVYERISDCNEAIYKSCSQTYPEAGVLVSF
jgi:hypothetical protein